MLQQLGYVENLAGKDAVMQPEFEHALEEDLERYSLGILPADALEVLEQHLLICPRCQDRLGETDIYVQTMQGAARALRAQPASYWSRVQSRISAAFTMPKLAWALPVAAVFVVCLLWAAGTWRLSPPAGSPPVAVALHAVRGSEPAALAKAPQGRALSLQADLSGLTLSGECIVEVVDEKGSSVRRSQARSQGSRVSLQLPAGLESGHYWVRLYAAGPQNHELLREYALRVE
jgi:hypothetical protein